MSIFKHGDDDRLRVRKGAAKSYDRVKSPLQAPRRRRRNFAVSNGFRHDIITNFDTIDQYHDARMSIPT